MIFWSTDKFSDFHEDPEGHIFQIASQQPNSLHRLQTSASFLNICLVSWIRDRQIIVLQWDKLPICFICIFFRLAKATLTLIPLFGIHEVIFVFATDEQTTGVLRYIKVFFTLFISSFQVGKNLWVTAGFAGTLISHDVKTKCVILPPLMIRLP